MKKMAEREMTNRAHAHMGGCPGQRAMVFERNSRQNRAAEKKRPKERLFPS